MVTLFNNFVMILMMEKEIVFRSIQAVLKAEEEVKVEQTGQDSLSTLVGLDSTESDDTAAILGSFCCELVAVLNRALKFVGKVKPTLARERAITIFQRLTGEELPLVWQCLSKKLKLPEINTHQQQSVNRRLFDQLLVKQLAPVEDQGPRLTVKRAHLTCEEDNAVRYAAGYVAMKLLKKYKKLTTTTAANYVECLSNMTMVTSETCREESFYDYTLEWISNVDRGGLFYINDDTFSFFKAIEIQTQECLAPHLRSRSSSDSKKELLTKIASDAEVQFWWAIVAIDVGDETEDADLLHEIVNSWVTIRGFSMTSNWLEQYKLAKKKSVKKTKSLRKGLQDE